MDRLNAVARDEVAIVPIANFEPNLDHVNSYLRQIHKDRSNIIIDVKLKEVWFFDEYRVTVPGFER